MTHLILVHPDGNAESRTLGSRGVAHRDDSKFYIHVPMTTNSRPPHCIHPRPRRDHLTLYIWTIRSPGGLASSSFTEYLISTSNSRELSSLFLHEKVPVTIVPS